MTNDAPASGFARHFGWIVIVAAAVALIETTVALLHPTSDVARSNFFDYTFRHREDAARVLVDLKLRQFADSTPTILQVGDSSGFHGVQPPVVESVLGNARFVNLDVFAFGYPAYYEMARYVLDRSPGIKVLVLYFTSVATPMPEFVDDGEHYGADIRREYNSAFFKAFHLPSLAARRAAADAIYAPTGYRTQQSVDAAYAQYPDAQRLLPQTSGWDREHDLDDDDAPGPVKLLRRALKLPASVSDDAVVETATRTYLQPSRTFDASRLARVSLAETVFESFRKLAEEHGAKLVLSAAPQPEILQRVSLDARIKAFNELLADYHAAHPEVGVVPFAIWPSNRFSSPMHIATPWTLENSIRLGQALKEAIGAEAIANWPAPAPARRTTVATIAMDAQAPVYAFAPAETRNGVSTRALRDGRDEGLVYANIDPGVRSVAVDLAPDVPPAVRASLLVSVFGEACVRQSEEMLPDRTRITFALPPGTMRYGGWVELLMSTRGRTQWPEDGLVSPSDGPSTRVIAFAFR